MLYAAGLMLATLAGMRALLLSGEVATEECRHVDPLLEFRLRAVKRMCVLVEDEDGGLGRPLSRP